MKYPDTHHAPFFSFIGVTVSMDERLFSKAVSNWITTYSPSGAPGKEVE